MIIEVGKKEYQLKFTFNSFKFMKTLNIEELGELETHPFMVFDIAEQLLLGALNNSKDKVFSQKEVGKILEAYVGENKSVITLVEGLMNELEESSFFKSLQAK